MGDHPTITPWGTPTGVHEIADGIIRFDTRRHGGIYLAKYKLDEMAPQLRELPPWAGEHWYERDVEWSLVVLSFPHFFTPQLCASAIRTARHWLAQSIDLAGFCKSTRGKKALSRAGIQPHDC